MQESSIKNDQVYTVTDSNDQPLLALPLSSILRQRLFYRFIAVAISSYDKKLFLHQRVAFPAGPKKQEWWGLLVTAVASDESRMEASIRVVNHFIGLQTIPVKLSTSFQLLSWHNFHGTLYKATLPKGIIPRGDPEKWLCIDEDETRGLQAESPEAIAPEIHWALEQQSLLFSKDKEANATKEN